MERLERFYGIHHLMAGGKCLPLQSLMDRFEVSRATLKRDIEYLRDRLHAPLIYDRERGGYRYDYSLADGGRYELPGVWFSPREIHSLVAMHAMLRNVGPGLLEDVVAPALNRIDRLLEDHQVPAEQVSRRIRVLNVGHRSTPPDHFATVAMATLQRRQLSINYRARGTGETTQGRKLSPQRLVHYRGTWYLDAWCYLRKALRSFSVDAMTATRMLDSKAGDRPEAELDAHYASSYGIFSGDPAGTAVLRFSASAASWVRHELWHPDQVGTELPDGRYQLEFPYGNDTELLMDVLRHGADVEVIAPTALRDSIIKALSRMTECYQAVD